MYSAFFGSVAVTHPCTVKRHIHGAVVKGEPGGCEAPAISLDEGVHLHSPGIDVTLQPKRPAATFAVTV